MTIAGNNRAALVVIHRRDDTSSSRRHVRRLHSDAIAIGLPYKGRFCSRTPNAPWRPIMSANARLSLCSRCFISISRCFSSITTKATCSMGEHITTATAEKGHGSKRAPQDSPPLPRPVKRSTAERVSNDAVVIGYAAAVLSDAFRTTSVGTIDADHSGAELEAEPDHHRRWLPARF